MNRSLENPWRRRFSAIYEATLHVAPDTPQTWARIREAARDIGMSVLAVDGAEFRTMEDVDRALAEEVMAPFPFCGWDAQYSILTNLEWFGNDVGYVLTVAGCDRWLAEWQEGFSMFVAVVTASSRLWQEIGNAFHVVFLGGAAVAEHVAATVERELRERPRQFDASVRWYEVG